MKRAKELVWRAVWLLYKKKKKKGMSPTDHALLLTEGSAV